MLFTFSCSAGFITFKLSACVSGQSRAVSAHCCKPWLIGNPKLHHSVGERLKQPHLGLV